MTPEPLVPRYGDRSLCEILGAITGEGTSGAMSDLTAALSGARSTVLVVADGLGAEQLETYAHLAPQLHGGQLEPATSVAPSTTAAALTSLMTQVTPGEHGIIGYRMRMGNDILQTLRWSINGSDASQQCRPELVQPFEPRLTRDGTPATYVGKAQYALGGFTRAHLRGATYDGIKSPEELVDHVVAATQHVPLVVAYHDAIDHVAHADGLGEGYFAEIGRLEAMVEQMRHQLSDDVAIVVVADHGQIDVGAREIQIPPAAMPMISFMSGEGRFRWLHAVVGEQRTLSALLADSLAETCWVWTRREAIALGLFGPDVSVDVEERLGDVCIVPFVDAFVLDPAEPQEARMRGRHGSLTRAEMLVPVIVR